MKAFLVGTFLTLLSPYLLANDNILGDWCHKYDDFTEAYKIERTASQIIKVSRYTIGNDSKEVHGRFYGHMDIGANNMEMFLKDAYGRDKGYVAQGLVDYQIIRKPLRLKRVKFFYEDGSSLTLKKCRVKVIRSKDAYHSQY